MTTIALHNAFRKVDGHTLLTDVSLRFSEGKINLLVGPNGAGKTTLLRVCALLDPIQGGRLEISPALSSSSSPVQSDPPGSAASNPADLGITMVFQRPLLFNRSVWENIAYPLRVRKKPRGEIKERVERVLEKAELETFASRKARSLSGGEAQRLALARAMVLEPKVLLLDEPSANLDPASRWRIEEMVRQMREEFGTTVVMTTHDLISAKRVGETLFFIHQGRVQGPYDPKTFFETPPTEEAKQFIEGVLHL